MTRFRRQTWKLVLRRGDRQSRKSPPAAKHHLSKIPFLLTITNTGSLRRTTHRFISLIASFETVGKREGFTGVASRGLGWPLPPAGTARGARARRPVSGQKRVRPALRHVHRLSPARRALPWMIGRTERLDDELQTIRPAQGDWPRHKTNSRPLPSTAEHDQQGHHHHTAHGCPAGAAGPCLLSAFAAVVVATTGATIVKIAR